MSDEVLECKAEICETVNQAYLNVKESKPIYAETIKKTVELLRRRGLQLTAQDIADELGLAFSTYYYYVEKAGVTYALIVNAVKTEAGTD
jgi:response regulator of citrate/malate metabolism